MAVQVTGGQLNGTPVFGVIVGPHRKSLERVTGAAFDPRSGVCYFPAFPPFTKRVIEDLQAVFPDLVWADKAKVVIDQSHKMTEDFNKRVLPAGIQFKMKPLAHQIDGLLYAYYHMRCGLLYDCGLGKTKIAIDLINMVGKKALILVPSTLISNWVDEFQKHSVKQFKILALNETTATDKRAQLGIEETYDVTYVKSCPLDEKLKPILTTKGKPKVVRKVLERVLVKTDVKKLDCDILLVSYDTAALYYEQIWKQFDYGIIIADESHKIKSVKSRRTQAALELSKKASRRMIMSGTAVLNDPRDLYPQLKFLSPQIMNEDYYKFCQDYLIYAKWNAKIPVGVKNLDKLNKVVRRYTVRKTKEECLDLPERLIIDRFVDLDPEQVAMYREVASAEDLYLPEGIISKEFKMVALNKLNQVTGGFVYVGQKDPKICDGCINLEVCVKEKVKPYTKACAVIQEAPPNKTRRFATNPKLDMCMSLVDEILATETGKVIIWAKALEELTMIEEGLNKAGVKFVRIKTDPKNDIEPFNTDPEVRVCIGNIAVGVGFTANVATYMIYYSLSFSLEHYLQSIDRNFRIGQKNSVTVYHLLARGTVDERVVEAIKNKVDIAESLLNNLECIRCPQMAACVLKGISQYQPGCVLIKKQTTRG